MILLNLRSLIGRHHFVSLTSASIVSYFYYHLLFRPISSHAVSTVKYCKIVSLLESNPQTASLRSITNNRVYLYISKFYSTSPASGKRDSSFGFSPLEPPDSGFRHTVLNMAEKAGGEEPEWAAEARGVNHPAFEKHESHYLSELGVLTTRFTHKATGLSVLSLKTDPKSGKEMCFDLLVPTPPLNSKGSPHVLEHCALAGTPKYPAKDGFSLLIQGGFSSYLNATTYKDRTTYQFASTNPKSFYQIADYYMDSVFRPNVLRDKNIFDQECWHYKVSDGTADRNDADLEIHGRRIGFAGIVYSEMRNAFSGSSNLFYYKTYEHLFNNSYKYVSGGDPKDIVDLTYPELLNFYRLYYGPKTSMLYLYGPYDVKTRLDFVDDYLTEHRVGLGQPAVAGMLQHSAMPDAANSNMGLQEYSKTPKRVAYEFSSPNENEDEFVVSWLLDPAVNGSHDKFKLDLVDNLGFQVLHYLLMGTPESVLYKALIDSGFGKKVIDWGFSNHYKQALFGVGIRGVDNKANGSDEEMVAKFEQIVFDTLNRVKAEGFKTGAILSGLNLVEFEMRELNSGGYPKGLMIINMMQTQMQYNRDPYKLLEFDALVAELKKRVYQDDPSKYFVNMLVKHLLNNTTRVTVHLKAVESAKFEKEFNRQVAEQLEKRLGHLSVAEVDKMEEDYKKFEAFQKKEETKEALDSLQTLQLSDISREQEKIPTKFLKLSPNSLTESSGLYNDGQSVTVVAHPMETQGILYMDYALALDRLSVDDLRYLGLMAGMLKEAGTDKLSPEELSYVIDRNLGGLTFSSYFTTQTNNETYDDPANGLGYLLVRAKCLRHKADAMVDVVNDVLKNANFGNAKKGAELAKRMLSLYQSTMSRSGNEYAARRMCSKFSVDAYAEELVNGYSQFEFLKETLVPMAESDWPKVEARLNAMRDKMLGLGGVTVNLTGDAEALDAFLKNAPAFHQKLAATFAATPAAHAKTWVNEVLEGKLMENAEKNELIVVPSRVNYVGLGGKLFDKTDRVSGANTLGFHYITATYLFRFVRMALGSYGVSARLTNTGHVVFMSYADPNFEKTLEVYRNVATALKEAYESFTDKDLLRQKTGKLGDLDKPLHAEIKSLLALKRALRGENDAFRQAIREDIMDATKEYLLRLKNQFERATEWNNVCAVVTNTTANEAPGEFRKLYIS